MSAFRSACHFSTQEIFRDSNRARGISKGASTSSKPADENARPGPDQLKKIETAVIIRAYSDKILPLARQTVQIDRVAYETEQCEFSRANHCAVVLQDVESAT